MSVFRASQRRDGLYLWGNGYQSSEVDKERGSESGGEQIVHEMVICGTVGTNGSVFKARPH